MRDSRPRPIGFRSQVSKIVYTCSDHRSSFGYRGFCLWGGGLCDGPQISAGAESRAQEGVQSAARPC